MNTKLQAKISAIIATVAGVITYLATLPPESQDAVTGPIVALIPLTWRPEVGLICKAVMSVSTFWAIFKAAHGDTVETAANTEAIKSVAAQTGSTLPAPPAPPANAAPVVPKP